MCLACPSPVLLHCVVCQSPQPALASHSRSRPRTRNPHSRCSRRRPSRRPLPIPQTPRRSTAAPTIPLIQRKSAAVPSWTCSKAAPDPTRRCGRRSSPRPRVRQPGTAEQTARARRRRRIAAARRRRGCRHRVCGGAHFGGVERQRARLSVVALGVECEWRWRRRGRGRHGQHELATVAQEEAEAVFVSEQRTRAGQHAVRDAVRGEVRRDVRLLRGLRVRLRREGGEAAGGVPLEGGPGGAGGVRAAAGAGGGGELEAAAGRPRRVPGQGGGRWSSCAGAWR